MKMYGGPHKNIKRSDKKKRPPGPPGSGVQRAVEPLEAGVARALGAPEASGSLGPWGTRAPWGLGAVGPVGPRGLWVQITCSTRAP